MSEHLRQLKKSSTDRDRIVSIVNDPFGGLLHLQNMLEANAEFAKDCSFLLCNAGTAASEHEGISAAGMNPAARRLTPALDAEALVLGRTISAEKLPVSPRGIVSPVVISRACLNLLEMQIKIIDCGSFNSPAVDCTKLSESPAKCPSSGDAMPYAHVRTLFDRGVEIGKAMSEKVNFLVLAECVPGGTTTALAVLNALGHEVNGLLSSSLPSSNHKQRFELVQKGLNKTKHSIDEMKNNALLAVAAVGDPMQAVAAGVVSSFTSNKPMVLAGGSQMLAVWAILTALDTRAHISLERKNLSIMSTDWVVFDKTAGVDRLAKILNAPLAASRPNFNDSRHPGLQAYEKGNVKEGVGAGASMCLANLAGFSRQEIITAVDSEYDKCVG